MDQLGGNDFSGVFYDFTVRCEQNGSPATVPLSWGIDEVGSPLYFGVYGRRTIPVFGAPEVSMICSNF
jgi:hypothetical protein